MARLIRAAGGVVWRVADEGTLEVIVIHRPLLNDWSLPKGKVDRSDHDEEHAALREVLEETGWRCALGRELPGAEYYDRQGRHKTVRYWEMRPVAYEGFTPNREVDEVRWVTLEAGRHLLSYESDHRVLAAFAGYAGLAEGRDEPSVRRR